MKLPQTAKRLSVLLAIAAVCFGLAACGGSSSESQSEKLDGLNRETHSLELRIEIQRAYQRNKIMQQELKQLLKREIR